MVSFSGPIQEKITRSNFCEDIAFLRVNILFASQGLNFHWFLDPENQISSGKKSSGREFLVIPRISSDLRLIRWLGDELGSYYGVVN